MASWAMTEAMDVIWACGNTFETWLDHMGSPDVTMWHRVPPRLNASTLTPSWDVGPCCLACAPTSTSRSCPSCNSVGTMVVEAPHSAHTTSLPAPTWLRRAVSTSGTMSAREISRCLAWDS